MCACTSRSTCIMYNMTLCSGHNQWVWPCIWWPTKYTMYMTLWGLYSYNNYYRPCHSILWRSTTNKSVIYTILIGVHSTMHLVHSNYHMCVCEGAWACARCTHACMHNYYVHIWWWSNTLLMYIIYGNFLFSRWQLREFFSLNDLSLCQVGQVHHQQKVLQEW